MATLKNTKIDDTGFIRLPSGTTAQRPSSPSPGMIRYNNTGISEYYNGTTWIEATSALHPANLVTKDKNGNPIGINYTKFSAYLIESVKALKVELNNIKGTK